ncbi:helix-turn-helix domain-containing protein [Mycolicibacterium tokaiense]|uniref:Possible transcriptional regulatory protein n=1 Tax=Mycolicibacterium tokaiense TaxID=39695 RepID=A0A378TJB4_9MYCO|nr:helix-turn-helix transcriptional regulator [Mycolicibacterium tokaiense]BBY85216.1 hypothetical protein MTOK_09980 [Mycolicibacterium tokaiense]STZ60277.1 Possible transcriptional regulatory protein [Mycolicibacterium tokaiense]
MGEVIGINRRRRAEPEPLLRELLGRRLRDIREHRGDRLVDVAARAGVSPQYLSEIERGRKEPSSEMIAAICGALEIRLIRLLGTLSSDITRAPAGPVHGPTLLAA